MDQFPSFLKDLDPEVYISDNYRVLDLEVAHEGRNDPSAFTDQNYITCWVGYDARTGEFRKEYIEEREQGYLQLAEYVQGADFIVAHFAKFELQWLARAGVPTGTILPYDTFLGEWVIAGNRKWPLDLSSTALRYGLEPKEDIVSSLIKGGVCPSVIPKERLLDYCAKDVTLTHVIFLKQRLKLLESGLLPVFYTRCLTTLVLADIEKYGMCLDGPLVKTEYKKALKELREIEDELHQLTGGINPKSNKQKAEFLYDKLGFEELKDRSGRPVRTPPSKLHPEGARKTDSDTVMALAARTKEQKDFQDAIQRFSPINENAKNLKKFMKCVEENDPPILYATLNQGIAQNHRLSSHGKNYKVQLHNINRSFKRLFKARREGWEIGEGDAPQLEFRAAMHLTGDPVGHKDIRSHFDVHAYTASVICNTPLEKVTKKLRDPNKPHTFKPLYGGKSGTKDERRYYQAFRDKYKVCYEVQTGWTYQVLKDKELRIPTGLIFYWPKCTMDQSGYIQYTGQIFNYPVSSLATADIIPIGLIYAWFRYRAAGLQSYIINTVHDSIVSEVHPDEKEAWGEIMKLAFTSDTFNYLEKVYGIQFTVLLGVEYSTSRNWGEADKKDRKVYEEDPMQSSRTILGG